jgi:hypothetical protein
MSNETILVSSLISLRWVFNKEKLAFGGQLLPSGEVRNVLHKSDRLLIPAETLQQAANLGLFKSLPCFVDHAEPSADPPLRDFFGIWRDAAYNPQAAGVDAVLDMEVYKGNLQIFAILSRTTFDEQFRPDICIVLPIYGDWQVRDGQKYLQRIYRIQTADLLFMPTSDGRIRKLLSAVRRLPELKQTMSTDDFDALLETMPSADPNYYAGLADYHNN